MNQKKQFSILEFSRLTGIKRENLRFYDRIGLLCPETRGENRYRYYSRHQLNTAYLITGLRGLGVGIEDIKQYSAKSSTGKALALLAQQDERIQAEIQHLRETRLIMRMHSDMLREALAHSENTPFLQEKEQEPIFLCLPIPAHMDSDEGGIFSYEYAEANGVHMGFPQGTMFSWTKNTEANAALEERYYFKTGGAGNACKPAGLYAVAYDRCDLWKTEALYQRLLDYIKEQGLCSCGSAYEEYPLNDIALQEIDQYCIRVEIPVVKADL